MTNQNPLLGIIWTLLFCFAGVSADAIVREMTMNEFPASEILFFRGLLGALLLLPFMLRKKLFKNTSVKSLKMYAGRGALAFCAISIWFYTLKHADFTALMAIGFTSTLFTSLLSILLLKEKPHWIKIVSLLIGFCGVIVVIDPMGAPLNIYLLIAMLGALIWAMSLILTKQLSSKEHPITISFFLAASLIPLAATLAFPVWQWPEATQWLGIIAFTCIASFAQFAMIKAFSYAELTTLMPFEFSQLIFAAIISYVIFSDLATLNTIIGGIIIFASGYMVIGYERKKHRSQEMEIVP